MNNNEMNLVSLAQKGDKNALDKLIKQEQKNIQAMLFYLKKDSQDLADIVQDVLVKLSKKITQIKNPKNFKTWLNQMIINSYYDYLRKNKKRKSDLTFDKLEDEKVFQIPDYTTNPSVSILNNELDFIIKTSIEKLPIRYKIPITLREIQGLSYDEISQVTNTSLGTVKSRIARARAMIKNDLNSYIGE